MYVIFRDSGTHREYLKKGTESLFNPRLSLAHIFLTHEDAVKANACDLWITNISRKELFDAKLKGK